LIQKISFTLLHVLLGTFSHGVRGIQASDRANDPGGCLHFNDLNI